MLLHGFYYGHGDASLNKLTAKKTVLNEIEKTVEPRLAVLTPEDYWRNYAVGMLQHAPQGYLAYKGASLWVRSSESLYVVEFTHKRMRGCTIPLNHREEEDDDEGDEDGDPYYHLVYDPWDWHLEENCAGKACSDEEIERISKNVDWTGELHEELDAIESLHSAASKAFGRDT